MVKYVSDDVFYELYDKVELTVLSCEKINRRNRYVFMGGTFDPIHSGHIEGALQVSKLLNDTLVHLLPAKVPVHKAAPSTSPQQRIEMLKLAVAEYPLIDLDLREINSPEDSFTIHTLTQLRAQHSESSIIMVIGMDSYHTLAKWHESDRFLSLCHILVLQRPQYQSETGRFEPDSALAVNPEELLNTPSGKVFFFEQKPVDISASEIRQQVSNSLSTYLLPPKVAEYINQHQLYQAGVSAN